MKNNPFTGMNFGNFTGQDIEKIAKALQKANPSLKQKFKEVIKDNPDLPNDLDEITEFITDLFGDKNE